MTKEEEIEQKADELYELCEEFRRPCFIALGLEEGEVITSSVNEVEEGFFGGSDMAVIAQVKSLKGQGLSDEEVLDFFKSFILKKDYE